MPQFISSVSRSKPEYVDEKPAAVIGSDLRKSLLNNKIAHVALAALLFGAGVTGAVFLGIHVGKVVGQMPNLVGNVTQLGELSFEVGLTALGVGFLTYLLGKNITEYKLMDTEESEEVFDSLKDSKGYREVIGDASESSIDILRRLFTKRFNLQTGDPSVNNTLNLYMSCGPFLQFGAQHRDRLQ